MGPQLDSCGRACRPPLSACPSFVLQWGRNLTVAEGLSTLKSGFDEIKLQWGRNLTVAEGGARRLAAAFL